MLICILRAILFYFLKTFPVKTKKTLGDVLGGMFSQFAKTSSLPERKAKKVQERIVLANIDDLIKSVEEISDDEIMLASTGVRMFFTAQEEESSIELNNAAQRYLLKKATSQDTKNFVSANMD